MLNDFFNIFLPQGCLGLFIIIELIMSALLSPKYYKYSRLIAAAGITLSAILLSTVQTEPQYFAFKNSVMSDSYTLLFHFVILLCGFFAVLLTKNLVGKLKQNAFTLHSLMLGAILGAMCIVSANDFLTLFISVELMSFPIYFLISSVKGYYSKEASFKYLLTGAVSTAVFLFGASYLYGVTSSVNFTDIYEQITDKNVPLIYTLSGIMIVTGLISKLAIFPFANWVIDVYKGCETSVLAFLSTVPKIAVFGILCRLLVFPLSYSFLVPFVLTLLAVFTAFWANTFAIREKNVKAILGCSTAANTSYMLIVTSLVSVYNLSTVIFYLICYVVINLSVFAFLNITEGCKTGFMLNDFRGLWLKNKGLCLAYTISVIALAGFPITSGFVAKIYLFSAIVSSGLIFIPVLMVLLILTVMALFYYLKLILPLFEPSDDKDGNTGIAVLKAAYSQNFIVYATTAVTVFIGIYPEKLIELCRFIAYNI